MLFNASVPSSRKLSKLKRKSLDSCNVELDFSSEKNQFYFQLLPKTVIPDAQKINQNCFLNDLLNMSNCPL